MISDGRWDCSCSLVLKEAERLTSGKHISIHTVTLSDLDRCCTTACHTQRKPSFGTSVLGLITLLLLFLIWTMFFPFSSHSTTMFLKNLAHKTGGRFHQVPSSADLSAAKELLSSGFSTTEVKTTAQDYNIILLYFTMGLFECIRFAMIAFNHYKSIHLSDINVWKAV